MNKFDFINNLKIVFKVISWLLRWKCVFIVIFVIYFFITVILKLFCWRFLFRFLVEIFMFFENYYCCSSLSDDSHIFPFEIYIGVFIKIGEKYCTGKSKICWIKLFVHVVHICSMMFSMVEKFLCEFPDERTSAISF